MKLMIIVLSLFVSTAYAQDGVDIVTSEKAGVLVASENFLGGTCNIVSGEFSCTCTSRIIIVGMHSGDELTDENDVVIVGNNLEMPKKGMSGHTNINGIISKRPNSADVEGLLEAASKSAKLITGCPDAGDPPQKLH